MKTLKTLLWLYKRHNLRSFLADILILAGVHVWDANTMYEVYVGSYTIAWKKDPSDIV